MLGNANYRIVTEQICGCQEQRGTERRREEEGIVKRNEETFGAMGKSTVSTVPGAHMC